LLDGHPHLEFEVVLLDLLHHQYAEHDVHSQLHLDQQFDLEHCNKSHQFEYEYYDEWRWGAPRRR